MVRWVSTIVGLAVLMVGCGSGDAPEPPAATPEEAPAQVEAQPVLPPESPVMDERLLGVEWQLEALGAVGEEKPILRVSRITLRFGVDGTLEGFSGCNDYRTTYRPHPSGEIEVRAVVRTNKSCTQGVARQEVTYLDVLERVESYELREGGLLLFYEAGSRNLVFRGVSLAEQEAADGA